MAGKTATRSLERVTRKVPGLKGVPLVALVSAAEVALLARDHLMRLSPDERHRLVELVRAGHGRPSHLPRSDRRELERLLDKLAARELFGDAVTRLSPVPLPRRLVYGPATKKRR